MSAGTVGDVQSQSYRANTQLGYGFVVCDSRGRPLVSITFKSREEATEAQRTFYDWVEKAVEIA
jgi:hypothetical protein